MRRVHALLFVLVSLAACPPHEDVTPQIPIQPGAAKRISYFASKAGARDAGAPSAPPARVHPLAKGEEVGGPNAVGRPGDIVLENDQVIFVIDQIGSSAGFAESGGNLVDAADAHTKKDELGMLFTYFGTFPRQGVYTRLVSGTSPDGTAWVEAKGHELYEPSVEVTTRYTLRPGDRAVLLETTLVNKGTTTIEKLGLGDAIQWGGAEKVAPGKPVGFRGKSSGPYLGGVGRYASYAITSTDGQLEAVSGGSWSDTEQRKDVALKVGESVQYARVFVVGERPDSSSIVSELALAAAADLGRLEVELSESGSPVSAPAGTRISLFAPGGGEVLTLGSASGASMLAGDVPPGKYEIAYASGGGRAMRGAKVPVEVAAGKTARVTLPVTSAGRLRVACGGPCKVTVEGKSPPDFGPAHAAGPAKNQVTTHDGAVDVPLAEGVYTVTVSRGPEYDAKSIPVTILPGQIATVPAPMAKPERVVDTTGYVSTDFHQHTMLGADSPVAIRDRVVANAAEGLEIAVASEHNVVADFEGVAKELGLGAELVQIAGCEITTDSSRKPWGHANVFPLPFEPGKARGGAPDTHDRTARDIFAEIRARNLSPSPIFQINHPRTNITGYFDQLGFDAKTGVGSDPGYDQVFDALEVWNGRNVDARDKVLADFFALLRTGHPVTATADTDTHGIVGQEAGYPRTYVRVSDDRHLATWDTARTGDLVRGVRDLRDVVLTNGPFLRVTANGQPIGGLARGTTVEVRVHVETAPWIKVDRVRVISARTGAEIAAKKIWLTRVPSRALAADVVFRLRADEDDAIVVTADGATPMSPVLGGDPREITPFAVTGAIWIDAGQDGESLGRRVASLIPLAIGEKSCEVSGPFRGVAQPG